MPRKVKRLEGSRPFFIADWPNSDAPGPSKTASTRLIAPQPPHSQDGYIEGAPQLVVEIAVTSASYDLHGKKEAYRRAGVREYIVWRVLDLAIDWFRLQEGQYVTVHPNENGIFESEVFPGLRLPVDRMLSGDLAGVMAVLDW